MWFSLGLKQVLKKARASLEALYKSQKNVLISPTILRSKEWAFMTMSCMGFLNVAHLTTQYMDVTTLLASNLFYSIQSLLQCDSGIFVCSAR